MLIFTNLKTLLSLLGNFGCIENCIPIGMYMKCQYSIRGKAIREFYTQILFFKNNLYDFRERYASFIIFC